MNSKQFLRFTYHLEDCEMNTQKGKKSQLDLLLESCWNDRVQKNCFRYTLDELETKTILGKYGLIAQLNTKRAIERRRPQLISDVIMKFDHDLFHFGKADSKEVLFQLEPLHWEDTNALSRHLLFINISPLEYCNSLLIPSIDKCYPQVLNLEGIRLALETVALSQNPDLKVGFNSLGGFASVNHLHFHLYYLKETLYLQFCETRQLFKECYKIENYLTKAFAFHLLEKENILLIATYIEKLVNLLQEEKIAHNVIMMRGKAYNDSTDEMHFNAVRIFVFIRKPYFGVKSDQAFCPAVCELSGHLLIKERKAFETITEDNVKSIFDDTCYDENTFSHLMEKYSQVIQKNFQ